jgi:hypothetical protein
MAPLQRHTFTALWLCYIAVVNAWTFQRTGRCMMTHRTGIFLALFPLSAVFWWFFEYLNRFVQNWEYIGAADLTPVAYFWYATIPFSTVLPAVLGTHDLLRSFPRLTAGLGNLPELRLRYPERLAWLSLAAATAGLAGVGAWPNVLFPMLWVAPLLAVTSIGALQGQPTVFAGLRRGDWRRIWLLALAAVVCGGFWEMWNWLSAAKWVYHVPYVHRFELFEMPLLGYAGYVPFGLECGAATDLFLGADGPAFEER